MTSRIKHFIDHIPGVQLAGEVAGNFLDVAGHDRLPGSGRELRDDPAGQSIMPDQGVASYLDVVAGTEGNKVVSGLKVVHPWLAAERTPLHMQFRGGNIALLHE